MGAWLQQPQRGIEISYELPAQTTLHEPIIISATAVNRSDRQIEIDFGWDHVGQLEFGIVKPDGSNVLVRPQRPDGALPGGIAVLKAGGRDTHHIPLNHWYDFDSAGDYRLTIKFLGVVRATTGAAVPINRTCAW